MAPSIKFLARVGLVSLGYAAAGASMASFSLHLGIPSPVFPATGIACGATLIWGARVAVGVFLGRLFMALLLGGTFGPAAYSWPFELWLALAVTLQALLAGWMGRRCLRADPSLAKARSVLWLIVAVGPASCWLAPLLGVPALVESARMPAQDIGYAFFRWWAGDSLGAVLVVPLLLLGVPRHCGRLSRSAPIVPLLLAAVLLTATLYTLFGEEKRRLQLRFESEAQAQASVLETRLQQLDAAAQALQALLRPGTAQDDTQQQRLLVESMQRLIPSGAHVRWTRDPASLDADLQALAQRASSSGSAATMLRARDPAELLWAVPAPGVVYITAPLQALLPPAPARWPTRRCLLDARTSQVLAGSACELARSVFQLDLPLTAGGQALTLRVLGASSYDVRDRVPGFLGVYLLALLGSVSLVAFIIVAAAKNAQVQTLVIERTQALRHSEAVLQSVFDAALVGIQYVDLAGSIERMNPESRRITGWNPVSVPQVSLLELIHPSQRAEIGPLIQNVANGQAQGWTREVKLLRADGRDIDVLLRLAGASGSTSRPLHLVAVLVDLTDLRKLQAAERARGVAEMASQAKNDFLSRMSHELRTPLNAILGFTQLMRERLQADAAALEQLAHVERAGWHLLSMINDILDLSRLEAGQVKFDMTELPLAQAVRDSLALVHGAAQAHEVATTLEETSPRLAVHADATRLQQVLLNLLSNAIKYNHRGGRVVVRLVQTGDQAGVEVEDDGPGIEAQALQQLFVPFNRLGRERSGIPGTGLGLVVSRQLVEGMSGHLTVRSTPGQGSTFTVMLRRAVLAEATPVSIHHGRPQGALPMAGRALYVEDNQVNVEIMRAVFAQEKRLQLQTCGTAAQALQRVAQDGLDLILLDLGLPDMDGIDLLQRLRELNPRACVIVVSADASQATQEAVMRAGAFACLPKPFDIIRLRTTVARAMHELDPDAQLGY